jgi:hypothetical protein
MDDGTDGLMGCKVGIQRFADNTPFVAEMGKNSEDRIEK